MNRLALFKYTGKEEEVNKTLLAVTKERAWFMLIVTHYN